MTPKYQTLKSCRKELEYAEKLEIRCRYRADFKPFGWLGLIAAGLLWFDFRDLSDKPVNRTMNKLINYIQTNIFQKTPTVFPDLEGRTLPVTFRNRHYCRSVKDTSHSEETTSKSINPSSYTIASINGQSDHRFTSLPHFTNTEETLKPLDGYETYPLVSLEESIKCLIDLFNNNIHRYVYIEQFIGQYGSRTIFSIEAIYAKFIREHAFFKDEDEIILPRGTHLKVIDQIQPAQDLTIIHL